MEAHGSPRGKFAQAAAGLLPDAVSQPLIDKAAIDRLAALHAALKSARRGGTVSISGVYGGELDPVPDDGSLRPAAADPHGSGQRSSGSPRSFRSSTTPPTRSASWI